MASNQDMVRVLCPFRSSASKQYISCEGLTADCGVTLRFTDKDACKAHSVIFCETRYQECPVYRMIYEDKYGDKDTLTHVNRGGQTKAYEKRQRIMDQTYIDNY